jgi:hypothetical protein
MKLGEVRLRSGDAKGARKHCQQAVELGRALVLASPNSTEAMHDLLRCYNQLGKVDLQRGDVKAAAASYRRAVDLAQGTLAYQALAASTTVLGTSPLGKGLFSAVGAQITGRAGILVGGSQQADVRPDLAVS